MTTRVAPVQAGESPDPHVNGIIGAMQESWWRDTGMASVLARRPPILKAVAVFVEAVYYKSGVDPVLLELMRIKTAMARDDPYFRAVRVEAVRDAVEAKVGAISRPNPQAGDVLTQREALGVQLAERMALNPHTVDDEFFEELRSHFTESEIVALATANSLFNLASCVDIALHLHTDGSAVYPQQMEYRQTELSA